jgi:hypothetical protein
MEEKKDFDSLLSKIIKYNPDKKKEEKSVKEDKGEKIENNNLDKAPKKDK